MAFGLPNFVITKVSWAVSTRSRIYARLDLASLTLKVFIALELYHFVYKVYIISASAILDVVTGLF